jgi:chloramphenicol-sensitive protein RarD
METKKKYNSSSIGFVYGIAAYTLWGFLPLYWKLLGGIPAIEILAHRILWSFVFLMGILYFQKNFQICKEVIKDRTSIIRIIYATIFITINWGLYIWSINSNHVVEASMGYYINPLIVILLSMIVLKEKLNTWQIISLVMAALGVLVITINYGQIPWISLSLALSFALYGLMKKKLKLASTISLALETAILMPLVIGYLSFRQINGVGALGRVSGITTLILIGSGIATALPLLWFGEGTRRIPLSSMGFLQYIAPTISLALGVFIFKEKFTTTHMLSFGFIWAGLIIYSISQIKQITNSIHRQVQDSQ